MGDLVRTWKAKKIDQFIISTEREIQARAGTVVEWV